VFRSFGDKRDIILHENSDIKYKINL